MTTPEAADYHTERTASAALYFLEAALRESRAGRQAAQHAITLGEAATTAEDTPLQIAEEAMIRVHRNSWEAHAANASILRKAVEKLTAITLGRQPEQLLDPTEN